MKIQSFLQSLPGVKRDNITFSNHFEIRHAERKDDLIPDIDGICQILIADEPVAISKQDDEKFEVRFNLDENYDLVLVVAVKGMNPEMMINLITCYKKEITRRMK